MENGIEFRDWELFPKPVDVDAVLEEDATLDPAAVSPSLSFLDFCAVAGAGANMSTSGQHDDLPAETGMSIPLPNRVGLRRWTTQLE